MPNWLKDVLLFPMAVFLFFCVQIFQVATGQPPTDLGGKLYAGFVLFVGLAVAVWFVIGNWQ